MTAAMSVEPNGEDAALIPITGNCNAHRLDGSGLLCRNRAGKGTDHVGYGNCYKHGGTSPNGRKNGRQKATEAAVLRLAGPNTQPVHDPAETLTQLAGEMRAWQQAARTLVDRLEESGALVIDDAARGSDVHPLVKLAERADDRLHRVLTDMAKLGLVERRIQIDEATTQALMVTIAGFLRDKLGGDQAENLAELGSRLRALEVGGVEP